MSMGRVILVASLLLIGVDECVAQVRVVRYGDERLVGVAEVDVLIVTSPVAGCRVDSAEAQELVLRLLREHGVRATASARARSWHYSVVVTVRTAPSADACVSAVSSELVAEVAGIPEADKVAVPGAWGSLLMGPMPLAHDMTLVISSRVTHDADVGRAVETQVTAIADRIRSANQ